MQWQLDALRAELSAHAPHDMANVTGDAAGKLWVALTEFAVPLEDPATIQASLKPSRVIEFVGQCERSGISVQARAGNGIVICHLPDALATLDAAHRVIAPLRELARSCGGKLLILDCDDRWKSALRVFGAPEPTWQLMRKLKNTLDPRNLLNPHRMDGLL